jgi:hypothetical protein
MLLLKNKIMNTKMKFLILPFLFVGMGLGGCKENTDNDTTIPINNNFSYESEQGNKNEIVKVLKDEQAYVRKLIFPNWRSFVYCFELTTHYNELDTTVIIPCGIPEKFKIDGLAVDISGNIIENYKQRFFLPGNTPTDIPQVDVFIHLFELNTIKIRKG